MQRVPLTIHVGEVTAPRCGMHSRKAPAACLCPLDSENSRIRYNSRGGVIDTSLCHGNPGKICFFSRLFSSFGREGLLWRRRRRKKLEPQRRSQEEPGFPALRGKIYPGNGEYFVDRRTVESLYIYNNYEIFSKGKCFFHLSKEI